MDICTDDPCILCACRQRNYHQLISDQMASCRGNPDTAFSFCCIYAGLRYSSHEYVRTGYQDICKGRVGVFRRIFRVFHVCMQKLRINSDFSLHFVPDYGKLPMLR